MKAPLAIRPNEVTYLMRCGDYVKIGHSMDAEARRRMFLPFNPFDITIIAIFPLGEPYERFLHAKFRDHWHREEWFRIEGDLAEWIARGCPHKREIQRLLKEHGEAMRAHAEWKERREQLQRRQEAIDKFRAKRAQGYGARPPFPWVTAPKSTM